MSLANRKFKNNFTGEIVKVIDSFEDIVILDNKTRTNPSTLMNTNIYSEISESANNSLNIVNDDHIDIDNFFGNQKSYDLLASKIKSIPQEYIGHNESNQVQVSFEGEGFNQPPMNESLIYETSERQEKEALAKKYNLIDEMPIHDDYIDNVQRIEVIRDDEDNFENANRNSNRSEIVDDPIIKMFKGVKRNVEFNMSIDFFDKIPRIDFIEMMEDSYETSIIDFLADEFTKKILDNPDKIKDSIKDKIKKMVYSSEIQDVKGGLKALPKLKTSIVDDKISKNDIPIENESKKEQVKTKRTYNRKKIQDTND